MPTDSSQLARLRWTIRTSRAARENRAFVEALEVLLIASAETGVVVDLEWLAAMLDEVAGADLEGKISCVQALLAGPLQFGSGPDAA